MADQGDKLYKLDPTKPTPQQVEKIKQVARPLPKSGLPFNSSSQGTTTN